MFSVIFYLIFTLLFNSPILFILCCHSSTMNEANRMSIKEKQQIVVQDDQSINNQLLDSQISDAESHDSLGLDCILEFPETDTTSKNPNCKSLDLISSSEDDIRHTLDPHELFDESLGSTFQGFQLLLARRNSAYTVMRSLSDNK